MKMRDDEDDDGGDGKEDSKHDGGDNGNEEDKDDDGRDGGGKDDNVVATEKQKQWGDDGDNDKDDEDEDDWDWKDNNAWMGEFSMALFTLHIQAHIWGNGPAPQCSCISIVVVVFVVCHIVLHLCDSGLMSKNLKFSSTVCMRGIVIIAIIVICIIVVGLCQFSIICCTAVANDGDPAVKNLISLPQSAWGSSLLLCIIVVRLHQF